MRCKTGDRALVLRGVNPQSMHAGKIVEVLDMQLMDSVHGPIWNIRLPSAVAVVLVNKAGKTVGVGGFSNVTGCPDAWLKPLRDPGDGAVDETLKRLPAPREAVPA